MAIAPGPLDELHAQLEDAVAQPGLTPAERLATLRVIREKLNTLMGVADGYIGDVELIREAEAVTVAESVMKVRQNATIRDELIQRGMASPEEMDEFGYVSHDELDRLREEGRLIESVETILAFQVEQDDLRLREAWHVTFDPAKHLRNRHGQFSDMLNKLQPKGRIDTPHGVSVTRDLDGGFSVSHPGGTDKHHDVDSAVKGALAHHDIAAGVRRQGEGKIHLPPRGRRGGTTPRVLHTHPPEHLRVETSIGVTPFYAGVHDSAGFYDSARAKRFEKELPALAKQNGVTLDGIERVTGVWEGGAEPAYDVRAHDGKAAMAQFAGQLRSRYWQDAVMAWKPSDTGKQVSYTLPGVDMAAAQKALAVHGIEGGRLHPAADGKVNFETMGSPADVGAKVAAMAKDLGVTPETHTGTLSWVSRPSPAVPVRASLEGVAPETMKQPWEPITKPASPPKFKGTPPKWLAEGRAMTTQEIKTNLETARKVTASLPTKGDVSNAIFGKANDTVALYSDAGPNGDRIWGPERAAFHTKVVDLALRQRNPDGSFNPAGDYIQKAEGKPIVVALGGGTASGKSSALSLPENKDLLPKDHVRLDSDELKGLMPEFNDMVAGGDTFAAGGTHEESSYLFKKIQEAALAKGLNVVLDGTGDSTLTEGKPGKYIAKLEAFDNAGYDVHLVYVNAPTDIAVMRATKRAMESGRWVPEPVLRSVHQGVSQRFNGEVMDAIKSGFIKKAVGFDTSGPTPVKMFEVPSPGKFVVGDVKALTAFKAKANG